MWKVALITGIVFLVLGPIIWKFKLVKFISKGRNEDAVAAGVGIVMILIGLLFIGEVFVIAYYKVMSEIVRKLLVPMTLTLGLVVAVITGVIIAKIKKN